MKNIWSVFNNSTRAEFIFLSILLSLNTLLETISISLLIPIIVSLTDNNLLRFLVCYHKFSLYRSLNTLKFESRKASNSSAHSFDTKEFLFDVFEFLF